MKNEISVEVTAVGIWLISFVISYLAIPRILNILYHIKLFDKPNERSSHLSDIPSMGGGAFYFSFISSLYLIGLYSSIRFGLAIVFSVTIMFFMGIKDDIAIINPQSKVIAQFIAALVLLPFSEFQIIPFDEPFFLTDISWWLNTIFSCILVFIIINAYNLIDGIDGLAGMMGIVVLGCFSFIFYQIDDEIFFILSFASTAFLLAFLRFNLSKSKKIFMGDTGSMIVGFIIAILSLHFLSLRQTQLEPLLIIELKNKLFLLFSILFIPIFDFARVFLLRVQQKQNPFRADRNHLHHLLVDKFRISHIIVSTLLSSANLAIFICIYLSII